MTWLSLTILLFVLGSGALYLLRVLKGKAINPAITDKTEKGEKAKTGQVRESNLYCQSATSDTCNVCLFIRLAPFTLPTANNNPIRAVMIYVKRASLVAHI